MLPLLTRIDHIGVACRDLDAAIGRYEASFGLQVVSLEVNEDGSRHGILVEYDATEKIFTSPSDERTEGYVTGRFG